MLPETVFIAPEYSEPTFMGLSVPQFMVLFKQLIWW